VQKNYFGEVGSGGNSEMILSIICVQRVSTLVIGLEDGLGGRPGHDS